MLDVVNTVVGALSSALPKLRNAKRDQDYNEIGADLLMLYVRLNDVLVCAESIVNVLQHYAQGAASRDPQYDDPQARQELAALAIRQRTNLGAAINIIGTHRAPLLVLLDGEASRTLQVFMDSKSELLEVLLSLLNGQSLPINSPTSAQIHELVALRQQIAQEPDSWEDEVELEGRLAARRHQILEEATRDAISVEEPWTKTTYKIVIRYLEVRKPEEQLEILGSLLNEFRAALTSNFEVKDLLLNIGDRRRFGQYYPRRSRFRNRLI